MIGWPQALVAFVIIVGLSSFNYLAGRFSDIERRLTALEERRKPQWQNQN